MTKRIGPGILSATALAFAVLCSLGLWQLKRLEWKRDLIAHMDERLAAAPISFDQALERAAAGENMEYQPVFIDGVYAHDLESSVFGTYEGTAGVYLFTPLDAEAGPGGGRRFIYVNRGFAPQAFKKQDTREEGLVAGEVRVEGLLRQRESPRGIARALRPKDQPADNLYFARDPQIIAARHQISVPPFYIDSFGRESAGRWPKGGVTRVGLANRHFEYALTWFGLAGALIAVFAAYVRRETRS